MSPILETGLKEDTKDKTLPNSPLHKNDKKNQLRDSFGHKLNNPYIPSTKMTPDEKKRKIKALLVKINKFLKEKNVLENQERLLAKDYVIQEIEILCATGSPKTESLLNLLISVRKILLSML